MPSAPFGSTPIAPGGPFGQASMGGPRMMRMA